jgi:hypothetical protein
MLHGHFRQTTMALPIIHHRHFTGQYKFKAIGTETHFFMSSLNILQAHFQTRNPDQQALAGRI